MTEIPPYEGKDLRDVMREHGQSLAAKRLVYYQGSFDATVAFGLEAIRTAAIVNGGAVIGMLTFIGSAAQSPDKDIVAMVPKLFPLTAIFILGVLLSGCASAFAYLSQANYTRSNEFYSHFWEKPYESFDEKGRLFITKGNFWLAWVRYCVGASYASIVIGCVAITWVYYGWTAAIISMFHSG